MADPVCDCCNRGYGAAAALTITSDHRGVTILCDLCEGLVEAGLVRPERAEDGRTVYRRWTFEWRPGELVAS